MKNYYQILEVPSDASQDIIKEQYRFLAQAWHPDKFPNLAQKIKAEEKIKEINAAYEILRNPVKRAEYDSSTRSSRFEQEYHRQEETQTAQRRAEDEQHKREQTTRQKDEQSRKERADKEKAEAAGDSVKVYIEGKERILSMDDLVKGSVQYFFEGESVGYHFFTTRENVQAQVNHMVLPHGYEIHVIKLAGQEQTYHTGREWPIKDVKVFVERNGKLEARTVQEPDLFGVYIRYYFNGTPILGRVFLRNLQDVKVAIRKCTKNGFDIVVEKFADQPKAG